MRHSKLTILACPLSRLLQSVQLAAKQVFEQAPEPSWRKVFAQTGLKSSSCSALRLFAKAHEEELRNCFLGSGYDSVKLFNHLVIEASYQLPEAQPTTDFTGDSEELLNLWLEGKPVDEIARSLDVTISVEQLSRYVEELFGYLLPWIISGLIRISKESLSIREKDLNEYIRSYPSMVKYGLPDPVAAWAMSAGIDTRSTALCIAEEFYRTIPGAPSHEVFIDWMADLSDESLLQELGVAGYTLENLRYRIRKLAVNPLLRPNRAPPASTAYSNASGWCALRQPKNWCSSRSTR